MNFALYAFILTLITNPKKLPKQSARQCQHNQLHFFVPSNAVFSVYCVMKRELAS